MEIFQLGDSVDKIRTQLFASITAAQLYGMPELAEPLTAVDDNVAARDLERWLKTREQTGKYMRVIYCDGNTDQIIMQIGAECESAERVLPGIPVKKPVFGDVQPSAATRPQGRGLRGQVQFGRRMLIEIGLLPNLPELARLRELAVQLAAILDAAEAALAELDAADQQLEAARSQLDAAKAQAHTAMITFKAQITQRYPGRTEMIKRFFLPGDNTRKKTEPDATEQTGQ